ncbi:MAG: response regulator, partial [Betaproteobacteria bacterium]|nr:response regulator [Betaproteobacteria bacterium]
MPNFIFQDPFMTKTQTILAVDADSDFLKWVRKQLETPNTLVLSASTADEAYRIFCQQQPDLLITDTHLHPFSGLELLVKVRQRDANAMVILTSAY